MTLVMTDASVRPYEVWLHKHGIFTIKQDEVAEEVPVAISYNGVSHVVMLVSPQDLADFTYGFSFTEGIIESAADIYNIEIQPTENGIVLSAEIASRCFQRLKMQRRNLTGRTGCGLCGSENLTHVLRSIQPVSADTFSLDINDLYRALLSLRQQQPLQDKTGATHASAWVSRQGEIVLLREDVGRHNALDKLIGALLRAGRAPDGFVITTSRASYEMVQKTICYNIPLLVAISAPSGLAIRMAAAHNLTLIGFAREKSLVVYSHPQRIH